MARESGMYALSREAPDKLTTTPPIVVSAHSCGSTASGQMGNMKKFQAAADTVSDIIAHRVLPTAIEFMERDSLLSVERYLEREAPFRDAAAHLLIQLDGNNREAVDAECEVVSGLCLAHGAQDAIVAQDRPTRDRLWEFRRKIIEALKPFADLMGPGTRGRLVRGFSGSQITNLAARFDFAFAALPERARILVADDDITLVRILETVLHGDGYDVDPAYDGKDALAKAGARSPAMSSSTVLARGWSTRWCLPSIPSIRDPRTRTRTLPSGVICPTWEGFGSK